MAISFSFVLSRGKDNFGRFWHERIAEPLINANAFEKIAIVTNRGLREISEIERQMKECLSGIQIAPHHDKWVDGSYCDTFKINRKLSVLLLIIPKEHQGALETVMLDAISENDYDRVIVNRTDAFSKEMQKAASKYISSERLRLKAHLGLTWAVQFPEKVFTRIDEQIRNVEWEKSDILKDCFSTL